MIELVVALAIVAILAAILLPALTRAKTKARTAQCVSNLRQLGVSLQIYLQDEAAFPLATRGDGLGYWQTLLAPPGHEKVLRCPQSVLASDFYLDLFRPPSRHVFPHYGYNWLGAVRRNPPADNLGLGGDLRLAERAYVATSENRVVSPADMIVLADSDAFLYLNLGQPLPDPDHLLYIASPHVIPTAGRPGVGVWHGGRANVLFADAHIESAPQAAWTAATPQSRRRWHNDNQPHPESW